MADKTIRTEFLIHDLKVPIAVIDAGARLLLEHQELYGPLTGKQIKVLKRIVRNTQTTRCLVNDALELGKSCQGETAAADVFILSIVRDILTEIFDLHSPAVSEEVMAAATYGELVSAVSTGGICLSFDQSLWGVPVCLDEEKTKQMLRNLVNNAFKFRKKLITISGSIQRNHMIFVVEDDGNGIAKEDQSRIFDSYFSLGEPLSDTVQSHGLGLSGVQLLLEDMGGALDLESETGRGAKFTLSIPLSG